jgi:hypothetical protein
VSMLAGVLHELPSKVATSPGPWSAAMQKVAEGHDTDLPKKTGSTRTGADQPVDANACDGPTSISSPTIPPTKAAYRGDCLTRPRREACLLTCPSSFRLQASSAKSSRTLITTSAQSPRSGLGLVHKLISHSFLPTWVVRALSRPLPDEVGKEAPTKRFSSLSRRSTSRTCRPLLNRSSLVTTRASARSRG